MILVDPPDIPIRMFGMRVMSCISMALVHHVLFG
jgi:hypothetical protein